MKLVLLSGGSGTRLWPLSNASRSKQFLKVLAKPDGSLESMVERVWRQIGESGLGQSAYLVAGRGQEDILRSQLGEGVPIIVEPERRDTFPAVALAASYLYSMESAGLDETVVVMPVDPYVDLSFFETIGRMEEVLGKSGADLALIGATPAYPSEKYGYMLPVDGAQAAAIEQENGYFRVEQFREKPGSGEAERLIRGGALWNCGVFAFRLNYLINLLIDKGLPLQYEEMAKRYSGLIQTSFDYEVLEKADGIAAVSYRGGWKDLGTWNTLTEEMNGRQIGKGYLSEDSANSRLINELDIPVAVLGIENAIVAAGPDGILVADKSMSHRIKEVSAFFDNRPMVEEFSWGTCRVIDRHKGADGYESLTRRVTMNDGENVGYHAHLLRREVWFIVSGEGEAVIGGRLFRVMAGDIVPVPQGIHHSIRGIHGLQYLEVQRGIDLSDRDVIRICRSWDDIAARHLIS